MLSGEVCDGSWTVLWVSSESLGKVPDSAGLSGSQVCFSCSGV